MESEQTRMLYRHDQDLYRGNGKPGITQRMAAVENSVLKLEEREEKKDAQAGRIELAVYVAVIAAIANFIAGRLGH